MRVASMDERYLPLPYAAKVLAMLAMQSERYQNDEEFRIAVDMVLAITEPVNLVKD